MTKLESAIVILIIAAFGYFLGPALFYWAVTEPVIEREEYISPDIISKCLKVTVNNCPNKQICEGALMACGVK